MQNAKCKIGTTVRNCPVGNFREAPDCSGGKMQNDNQISKVK